MESLPLQHMRESPHRGVPFVRGSLSHFKMILRKPRSVMKPTGNEMEYAVGLYFVHNMSLPFDHTCCLDESELETCLFFSCVVELQSKATMGVVLSRSSSSNRSIRWCPLTLPPSTQAAHQILHTACPESSCSCFSLLVGFFRIHSDSGNFCFPGFFIFLRFPFRHLHDILQTGFDVITNWCNLSIQSFRWTYERTALPSSFPDC